MPSSGDAPGPIMAGTDAIPVAARSSKKSSYHIDQFVATPQRDLPYVAGLVNSRDRTKAVARDVDVALTMLQTGGSAGKRS